MESASPGADLQASEHKEVHVDPDSTSPVRSIMYGVVFVVDA